MCDGISCAERLKKCCIDKWILFALESVGNIVPTRVHSLNETLWSYVELYLSKRINKFETILLCPEGNISVRLYGSY